MRVTVDIHSGPLQAAVKRGFVLANERLGVEAQQEITSNKWEWPVEPSPRDIVDDGQLRDSYRGNLQPDELNRHVYDHEWPVAHAMANHEGAVYRNGSSRPGRPWTKEPLARFKGNVQAQLRAELERLK